jgi:hypothetical protein
MSSFLCGYEDESIYAPEIENWDTLRVKNSPENMKQFPPRYGAGQRLDIRIGQHVQVGVYELAGFYGANDLNRFANPLQVYYLSNQSSGTDHANLSAGADINVIVPPFRLYAEFLDDDLTMFEDAGNPNKYAYQLGMAYYGKTGLIETGFEYTHVARYVYGHSSALNRHAHWYRSMGWPWGNELDLFHAHSIFRIIPQLHGRLEFNYWLLGSGRITDDWYIDGSPDLDNAPYWPRGPERIVSIVLGAEYKPWYWLGLTASVRPSWVDGKQRFSAFGNLFADIPVVWKISK